MRGSPARYERMPIGGHTGGEIIPSIPDAPLLNKFGREAVINGIPDPKATATFYRITGEMHITLCGFVEPNNFNKGLEYVRRIEGTDNVKSIVLWVSSEVFADHYLEFQFQGYTRDMTREKVTNPLLCLVKIPARYWKVGKEEEIDE